MKDLGLRIVQALIIFAVCSTNIYWQITPNTLLAGINGAFLAYGLTVGLPSMIAAWREGRIQHWLRRGWYRHLPGARRDRAGNGSIEPPYGNIPR